MKNILVMVMGLMMSVAAMAVTYPTYRPNTPQFGGGRSADPDRVSGVTTTARTDSDRVAGVMTARTNFERVGGVMAQVVTRPFESGVAVQPTYMSYKSTIYAPGATTLSTADQDYTPFSESTEEENTSRIRRLGGMGAADGDDPGKQGGSPIGAPWVLLLFAVAYVGFRAIRRKRQLTINTVKSEYKQYNENI